MFRKFTLVLSLILTMGFAISTSAAAQEAPPIDSEIEGLESGYARMFMPDFSAMIESASTPGAEFEFDEDAVQMVMASAMTFDSDDSAEAAIDAYGQSMTDDTAGAEGLEVSEVDDLGNNAVSYHGDIEGMSSATLLIQDGNTLFMIMVMGGEAEEGQEQARAIAEFMLDGEIETEEVTFNSEGTSTGGVFDLMPTAEDEELVSGLQVFMDVDYMNPEAGF